MSTFRKVVQAARKILWKVFFTEIPIKDVYDVILGFIRGTFYIFWYRLTRRNTIIRFPFMAYAPVRIVGPGSVFIDEGCSVFFNLFEGLTLVTLSPEACIHIGKKCDLGGLTVRCRHAVTIGDKVMTAASLIQDVMLAENVASIMGKDANRYGLKGQEIVVGPNAWLCSMSAVLAGARIAEDCVLSVGTCVMGERTDNYTLLMGNPLSKKAKIDILMRFKGNL